MAFVAKCAQQWSRDETNEVIQECSPTAHKWRWQLSLNYWYFIWGIGFADHGKTQWNKHDSWWNRTRKEKDVKDAAARINLEHKKWKPSRSIIFKQWKTSECSTENIWQA